jgi:hypothetical protein
MELTQDFLGHPGQRAGFLLLGGFLASWLFIRTSARLIRMEVSWWPGNVETKGGLHVHHLVWGILLVLVTGFLGFALRPESPWQEVLATLFGVGTGLTLDEFALWLRLEDVYWSEQGRESIDAVVVAAILGAMVVLGVAPFDVRDGEGSVAVVAGAVAFHVGCCATCMVKGKVVLGLVGLAVPFAGLAGALRLAKPGSPWARRRYREGSRKLDRSHERWRRIEARRRRAQDVVAGAPSRPGPSS